jgi:Tfp pilus assembly protein PilF
VLLPLFVRFTHGHWLNWSPVAVMTLIDNLETMLHHGQDNALVRYGLGNEYLKLRQYDRAVAHLRKAVEFDPKYSAAWKLLGKAHAGAAQTAEAIAAYETGIRAAEAKGDIQAAKEMRVFLKRLSA